MSTVTGVLSLAVPANDGVVSFERTAGESSVTLGGAVSIVKSTRALVPGGFPSELV
jgi:hypothetical protein